MQNNNNNVQPSNIEIQSQDVIKLILQFLKENSLGNTLSTLQEETGLYMNIIDNQESFLNDIRNGNWDKVLTVLQNLKLSLPTMITLYEQIIVELLHINELELVKHLLRKTEPMNQLKQTQIERYMKLENYLANKSINLVDFYPYGITTEKRRKHISELVREELTKIPSSRLLGLLSDALQWNRHIGKIPNDCTEFDLLSGKVPEKKVITEDDEPIKTLHKTIKFNDNNKPEVCKFSPDSKYLVTGSADGFIEAWDVETAKLSKNLPYQAADEFMMHDDAILCLAFSDDGEYLASGSLDGQIKIWQFKTGKLLRKFEPAHLQGVTCLQFSKNSTQILSGSYDSSLKIFGLKSGKALKMFKGHKSFVNGCYFTPDEDRVLSCASDGKIKIWDAKTAECIQTLSPIPTVSIKTITIKSLSFLNRHSELTIVCTAPSISIYNLKTQNIVKEFKSDNNQLFICCTTSTQQNYLYAVTEDHILYCFDIEKGTTLEKFKISDKDIYGLAFHPNYNLLASYGLDPILKIWKS
ncbi:hypothetical protein CYY_002999 [Polysphondylium violaceum]|uniref:WD40 repeat-containing protein SMU1 n=1 Tax=Polysphondylium violaceum TaxID=133409 RepID=A0A8J4Q7A8_9MYCE|nr:hypothetical protein CYY_002999 [Polysphondylium violaceum]